MKSTLLLLFAMLLSSLVSSGQVSCNEKSIGGWQQLNIDYTAANATEYIQVNIANASARTAALFDNLTITETPPVIVQENHYDPWGVNLVGIEKELLPVNRFKFLGRETQAETGWVDLMQRMYEPPLGRFTSVDPVTASQESLSTYQYGWNNPVLRSDRNGDCPECPESGFLIARLMTTAFYDTKHAIANSAFRAVRSDLRADYKVENGQQVFETSYTRQPQDNSVSGVAKEVINTIADVAVVVGVKGGGGNIGLLSKTSETQGVRAAKDVVNLRHYTSNKGIEGIQKDLEIKAFDQNKIFAEKANGKPLSSAQASEKYGINKKDARNYIEFQVPASSVEKVNNATTGSIEQTIRGNVKLNPETTKFVKRNQ